MVTVAPTKTIHLPPELILRDAPLAEALVALCARLVEIAEQMPLVSDIDCTLSIDPGGRATLYFRACR